MATQSNKVKVAIAGLALSAAGLVGIVQRESYTDNTVIPTKGDKPTNGFGMTERPDGTPVQMGDKTNPVQALQRTLAYLQKGEVVFKRCVQAPLTQGEYDLYVKFFYNIGPGAFCASSIPKKLNAGDYVGACKTILQYKFAAGFDCSTPGNKRCGGVWRDRQEAYAACMGEQS